MFLQIQPSLYVGQRVRYVEDGILSMYYGVIESFDFVDDCVKYKVKWDDGKDLNIMFFRSQLCSI